ncbi:hypothetical protein LOC71_04895 [Rhodopirellula sp. JC740]|uniref:Uncharacterized protein n=1 Tax=Rhodopirellula halodulae TaxID=2894198 RepID=A0ABS8NDG9_9BACT|nr:hypothetical protein [Rhodopirellula sp. JC740]MCC9641601.1 hypothetical protein [Rhodopirellula sp. JC740]
MPITRQHASDALARWQPAPVFLDSYRTKQLPENLDIYFGPPEEFFLSPDTQILYTADRIVPILDNGNFDLVLFDDPDANQLIYLALEDPDEVTRFRNWQQYLAHLMLDIGESCDDDDRIRRIADLVQFRHINELFVLWERVGDLPYDQHEQECRAFVETLD